MDKLFKAVLLLLITILLLVVLLLAYAARYSTARVGVKHTENVQDETRILSGKSIQQ